MRSCGKWAWYHPERGVSRFYCGSMRCKQEKCQKLFWSRRVRLISDLIATHELIRFFTLTLDRDIISGDPWDYIHHVWSKFRKRMNRRFDNFKYVAVLEAHKNKRFPHIHGFTNVWMDQASWSNLWCDSGGGKMVWIEAVKTPELSEYVSKQIEVAKYVGKENLEVAYKEKKNHRTLWRSEKLKASFEIDKATEWCIIKKDVFYEGEVKFTIQHEYGVDKHGKNKRQRKDVEAARSALFKQGTQTSFTYMETEKSED